MNVWVLQWALQWVWPTHYSGFAKKKKKIFPPWKLHHLNSSSQLSLNFCWPKAFFVTAGVVGCSDWGVHWGTCGCVQRQLMLIIVCTVAFQQWLHPNSPRMHKIMFSLHSDSKVAIFWKCAANTKGKGKYSCQLTVLFVQFDRTSDVSDLTSPECNFLATGLKNKNKQTKKLCIMMMFKVGILYVKIKFYALFIHRCA